MPQRSWAVRSDLTGLWEECPRCFYLSVVRAFPRPHEPATLTHIDGRLKACAAGRRTETLAAGMPAGTIEIADRWVESRPLDVHLPDAVRQCVLRGTLDTLVRLDDGGWAVVEISAALPPEPLALAARRLLAHAWALEHPAPGSFGVGPVTRLGLLVFEPQRFLSETNGLGSLTGGLRWIEIARDDAALLGFLAEVLSVLDRSEPPGGAPLCQWCVYRDASRRTGL